MRQRDFSLFTFHYSLFTKEENVTSFLLGFLSPYPYSYIRYSRQDVALHAVADGDVDGVTFHQFHVSDGKLILIVGHAVGLEPAVFVGNVAFHGVAYRRHAWHNGLFHHEVKVGERECFADAQTENGMIVAGFRHRRNIKQQRVILLPTLHRRAVVLIIDRAQVA